MLSTSTIDNLIQPMIDRQESINMYVINKIATRLRDVGELRPADLKNLQRLVQMGNDIREINSYISAISDMQVKDIKRIIKISAADTYLDMKPFYDYRHKSYIPFEKNKPLQDIVKAVGNETANNYVNLSNSKATGFMIQDLKNPSKLHFQTIDKTYQQVIDEAIQSVQSGVVNADEAIRRALKQLLNSGVRRLYWDSGYTQRLDTAVRRNILDGIKAINQQIANEAGKQFGADGVELSAHANSAPDHEPFQGHIFKNAEWDKLQSSQDFKDINGISFGGVQRIIGMWNCYHIAYPIVIGAKKPRYTPEQLQKFIDDNHEGYTLENGKHLTLYECSQLQRNLETKIRYAKEEQMAMSASGQKDASSLARSKVIRLTQQYKLFSKECGLKAQIKRTQVPGYRAN